MVQKIGRGGNEGGYEGGNEGGYVKAGEGGGGRGGEGGCDSNPLWGPWF